MLLVLNNRSDASEVIVGAETIKLVEDAKDGQGGSHIVFGADMGRIVSQSPASIAAVVGVVVVKDVAADVTVSSLAKAKSSRKK